MIKQFIQDSEKEFKKKFVWNMTTDDHDVVAHYNEEDRKLEFWNDYKILAWHRSQMEGLVEKVISETKEAIKAVEDKYWNKHEHCPYGECCASGESFEDLKAKLVESLKE